MSLRDGSSGSSVRYDASAVDVENTSAPIRRTSEELFLPDEVTRESVEPIDHQTCDVSRLARVERVGESVARVEPV